jgi:hypothetical protein
MSKRIYEPRNSKQLVIWHGESTKTFKASFVSIGLIRTGIDKCNTKIMIDTIRDRDLFRVEN